MTAAPNREPVGELTMTSTTYYYEEPCGNADPHPAHMFGVSGGGGGAASSAGPLRGKHVRDGGRSSEIWCPGVRGLMSV